MMALSILSGNRSASVHWAPPKKSNRGLELAFSISRIARWMAWPTFVVFSRMSDQWQPSVLMNRWFSAAVGVDEVAVNVADPFIQRCRSQSLAPFKETDVLPGQGPADQLPGSSASQKGDFR